MNVDQDEVEKFSSHANEWWDQNGKLKTLHHINPIRIKFIKNHSNKLDNLDILDVGCGGGILTESLAGYSENVTGIDMAKDSLEIAKEHALTSGLDINYVCTTAEQYSKTHNESFDIVTCLELIEHVPNPESLIKSCLTLLKPHGDLYISTINRNIKSYLTSILIAEYLLKLIPKGTHTYNQYIRPSEMISWIEKYQGKAKHIKGISYNPITKGCKLTDNIDINYIMHIKKL